MAVSAPVEKVGAGGGVALDRGEAEAVLSREVGGERRQSRQKALVLPLDLSAQATRARPRLDAAIRR